MGNLLSLSMDHRSSNRIYARKSIPTVLELDEGDLLEGAVADVSNRGIGLRLELPRRLYQEGVKLKELQGRLRIGDKDNPLLSQSCIIRHSSVDIHPNYESHALLGVSLPENQSLSIEKVIFQRDDEEIDVIEGEEKLAEIVRDLFMLGEKAVVCLKVGDIIHRGVYRHDTKLKTIRSLKIELLEEEVTSALSNRFEYTFFMELYGSFHLFRSRIKKMEGKTLELSIPDRIIRITRRLTQRVKPKENEEFTASFTDSFTGETVVARIEDFTERGFAAVVENDDFMLPTACRLPDIELRLGSKHELTLEGHVVHCETRTDGSVHFGVNISENSEQTLLPLFERVVHQRYPDIVDISSEHFDANWKLFEAAGYLHKKDQSTFELVRPQSFETWARLSASEGELARNFGIAGQNILRGGLHLTRMYSDTWIIHHLSILQGHQRHVTPQLFGGLCDYLIQVGALYGVSYTDAESSWNAKNYYNFVKEMNAPEETILRTYELYEFKPNPDEMGGETPGSETVRWASKYDRLRIAKHIQEVLPEIQIRAFDLERDTIEGDLFRNKFKNHSLLRDRRFLVWGPPDRIEAYAMCDVASDAINIFSLLDKVEVFFLQPVSNKKQVLSDLLRGAKRFYLSQGKRVLLFFSPEECLQVVSGLGGERIYKINMWLGTRKMIPRYKDYNARLFGRLMARVQSRSSLKKS